jgi:hypothetical protein
MPILMDMDNKARIPADREAAEALADKLARETGKPVKVYQEWDGGLDPDYLVTIEPDPIPDAGRWFIIYRGEPDS